jgi:hypothetical protein
MVALMTFVQSAAEAIPAHRYRPRSLGCRRTVGPNGKNLPKICIEKIMKLTGHT